eukprot:TRINITY_DN25959_c0_g1_i4.p2 TRINITY_DN25959_c0_g1~~TRINITY_DN25959_c0_g1_i4.p2  ORF type:complete len:336 (+),score=72.82 TRINITY_DN25959_c0_g1_i4:140-1147(+)
MSHAAPAAPAASSGLTTGSTFDTHCLRPEGLAGQQVGRAAEQGADQPGTRLYRAELAAGRQPSCSLEGPRRREEGGGQDRRLGRGYLASHPGQGARWDLPGEERDIWQALYDAQCFTDAACTATCPVLAPSGSTYRALQDQGDAILIKRNYVHKEDGKNQTYNQVWVKKSAMIALTEREVCSQIAGIYKLERKEDGDAASRQFASESMLLWHGSNAANFLAIVKQGLRVKPPTTASHQGSAFGNGIYFANAFRKSRGYCSLNQGAGFMLLCEVQLGKVLPGKGFSFQSTVVNVLVAGEKKRLGLPSDAKEADHPELKATQGGRGGGRRGYGRRET